MVFYEFLNRRRGILAGMGLKILKGWGCVLGQTLRKKEPNKMLFFKKTGNHISEKISWVSVDYYLS